VPPELTTREEIERGKVFARQIREALADTRRARLSDGRPFAQATATVKEFFRQIDASLNGALDAMTGRLTRAARRQQEGQPQQNAPPAGPVSISFSGEPVLSVRHPEPSDIPLVWTVERFDRAALDLEALRPFLTKTAILGACRKHLEMRGPNLLAGVTYAQVAAPI
jgi:hypothetical protein